MLFDYSQHREVYLVFHDDTDYLGSGFIKKGYKHVFALERQALGWLCIDPSRSDLSALILPASWRIDIIPEFKQNNPSATLLPLVVAKTSGSNYPRAGLISCVSAMQYYLGIYWPHVLTPWRLYHKIITKPPKHIEVMGCQEASEPSGKPKKPQDRPTSNAVN